MTPEREKQIRTLLQQTEAFLEGRDTACPNIHGTYLLARALRDVLTDRAELLARIGGLAQYSGNLRRQVPDDPDLGGPDD